MADFPKFDEEFKQNVSEKFQNVKEKVSDALLTEEGKLDTERIGNAVTDTAKKVEDTVRGSYQKFQEEYVKDGTLDKEKLGEAANRSYRKAGRSLATAVTRLANFLTDKFGTQSQNNEIVDAEVVAEAPVEEPAAEEIPVKETASAEVTAEPDDFVTEE
jgi:phosphatidate phosphatase PAH1